MRYLVFLVLVTLLFTGCATTPNATDVSLKQKYCGSFFLYRMCATDFTEDGIVDAVYFEDTREVFLYLEESEDLVKDNLPFHECAQIIDEPLGAASDRLLTINDSTGYLKELNIKSDILMHYMRYTDRVNKCNEEHGNVVEHDPNAEDDFDDFSYDEYDY